MELFLFIANLFNQFRITKGKELPSLERHPAGVIQVNPFTCRVEKRH
jgi:hypothetical protein